MSARTSVTVTSGLPSLLRSFRLSTWLGWQIESNWADPFLFAVYSLVKQSWW
jgi:ABC-2 type transport system permease protein